jgi:hypothetical protein
VEASTADGTPFPVALAAIVALCTGGFLILMGIIGVAAADSVGNPFGTGVLILGILFCGAALLLFRGSRLGRDAIGLLCLVGAVGGLIYTFQGPTAAIVPSLITAGVAAGVIALLYVPEGSKAFFR